jgi:hypothetical protein
MARSLNPTEIEQERERLMNGDAWPRWPWLPVKRTRDGLLEVGLLMWNAWDEDANRNATVYLANMIEVGLGTVKLEDVEVKKYDDLYAMLDDGWVGD